MKFMKNLLLGFLFIFLSIVITFISGSFPGAGTTPGGGVPAGWPLAYRVICKSAEVCVNMLEAKPIIPFDNYVFWADAAFWFFVMLIIWISAKKFAGTISQIKIP